MIALPSLHKNGHSTELLIINFIHKLALRIADFQARNIKDGILN